MCELTQRSVCQLHARPPLQPLSLDAALYMAVLGQTVPFVRRTLLQDYTWLAWAIADFGVEFDPAQLTRLEEAWVGVWMGLVS